MKNFQHFKYILKVSQLQSLLEICSNCVRYFLHPSNYCSAWGIHKVLITVWRCSALFLGKEQQTVQTTIVNSRIHLRSFDQFLLEMLYSKEDPVSGPNAHCVFWGYSSRVNSITGFMWYRVTSGCTWPLRSTSIIDCGCHRYVIGVRNRDESTNSEAIYLIKHFCYSCRSWSSRLFVWF